MTIKPLNDNVLVKLEPEDETKQKTTESGILLVNKKPGHNYCIGTVVAMGNGRVLNDGSFLSHIVNVGDRVMFYQYAGLEIIEGSDKYLMMKENEIIAFV